MFILQYDPGLTGYEIERRRSAAGLRDATAARRPSLQVIREALAREDLRRISARRH